MISAVIHVRLGQLISGTSCSVLHDRVLCRLRVGCLMMTFELVGKRGSTDLNSGMSVSKDR